jgi:hypothetical protein
MRRPGRMARPAAALVSARDFVVNSHGLATEAAMVRMTPRLARLVTGLAAAMILLGIVDAAMSADDDRLRTKSSVMKSSSDAQGTLAGNLKASVKSKRSSTTISKTRSDTTQNTVGNMK